MNKEEFEKLANRILDIRFNNGRARIRMYVDDRNHAVFRWLEISSISNDWSKLEVEEYCKAVNNCVIAAETLSQVWRFIGKNE